MDAATDFTSIANTAAAPTSQIWSSATSAPRLVGLCFRLPACALPSELTVAERRIVRGLLSGDSNHAIALSSRVSIRTIAVQLNGLYDKFNVSSRFELLAEILGSNSDQLTPEHLTRRANVFNAEMPVFDVELLFGDHLFEQRPLEKLSFCAEPVVLWRALLMGERAIVARRQLGDLHFVVLGDRSVACAEALFITRTDLMLLKGLASAMSNRHLANTVGMSESTISILARQALSKLGLSHRAELLRLTSG